MNITVEQQDENETSYIFSVSVADYRHSVTVQKEHYRKLTGENITPDELVRQSFEFLLAREDPTAILQNFDLSVIQQYSPDYESKISELN